MRLKILSLKASVDLFRLSKWEKRREATGSLEINWGRLPFTTKLKSSSIYKNVEVNFHLQKKIEFVLHLQNIEVVFHFQKNLGCLPFTKKVKVVFFNAYGIK